MDKKQVKAVTLIIGFFQTGINVYLAHIVHDNDHFEAQFVTKDEVVSSGSYQFT